MRRGIMEMEEMTGNGATGERKTESSSVIVQLPTYADSVRPTTTTLPGFSNPHLLSGHVSRVQRGGEGGEIGGVVGVGEVSGLDEDDLPPPYSPGGFRDILSQRDVYVAPPEYFAIFGQIREAREESTNNLVFIRKLCQILLNTIGCTVLLIIFMAIPLAMLGLGSRFINDCPAEPNIPIFLVVGGVLGSLKNIAMIGENIAKRMANRIPVQSARRLRYAKFVWRAVNLPFNLFLLVWVIVGSYWVYHIRTEVDPDYDECHEVLYKFAFGVITSSYILFALMCCCMCICGLCLIQPQQSEDGDGEEGRGGRGGGTGLEEEEEGEEGEGEVESRGREGERERREYEMDSSHSLSPSSALRENSTSPLYSPTDRDPITTRPHINTETTTEGQSRVLGGGRDHEGVDLAATDSQTDSRGIDDDVEHDGEPRTYSDQVLDRGGGGGGRGRNGGRRGGDGEGGGEGDGGRDGGGGGGRGQGEGGREGGGGHRRHNTLEEEYLSSDYASITHEEVSPSREAGQEEVRLEIRTERHSTHEALNLKDLEPLNVVHYEQTPVLSPRVRQSAANDEEQPLSPRTTSV